jgi:AbrB family looped-hinge helix DNA binding protein
MMTYLGFKAGKIRADNAAISWQRLSVDARLTHSYLYPMPTTRLSSKGQVILPKSVRDARHWGSGTAFSVELVEDGVLLRPMQQGTPARLLDVAGRLRKAGPAHSTEEMDEAITAELRHRHDRGRH